MKYLILLLLPVMAISQTIGDIDVWEWDTFGTNQIDDVAPSPLPQGNTGQSSVIIAWSGGTYDSDSGRLLVWGGGHEDYAGNEVYSFDFSTFTWSRITDATGSGDIQTGGTYETYDDGNPGSRHTYSGVVYAPAPYLTSGAMVIAGGSLWDSGYASGRVWTLQMSDCTWTNRAAASSGYVFANAAYSAYDSSVYIQREGGMFQYKTSDNSVTTLSPSGDANDLEYEGGAAFRSVDSSLYYMGNGSLYQYNTNTNVHDKLSTTDSYSIESDGARCLIYDPENDCLWSWTGGQTLYKYTFSTATWSTQSCTGDTPTSNTSNGVYGRFFYMPDEGCAGVVNAIDESVYVVRLHNVAGDSSGTTGTTLVQSFQITADTTATNPFTVGLGFTKGDADSITINVDDYQVDIMKTWNDGSIKHAIVSGEVAMTANVAKTINVYSDGTVPYYSALTEDSIVTAAPTATIGISGMDTVSLADLLGSPVRTWLTGQTMVEAHYQKDVGDDVSVWFHVRLYDDGDMWVRAIVDNGVLDRATSSESYTATIIIDGNTEYSSAVTHRAYTRFQAEGWVDQTGPSITIDVDCDYLKDSGLVPNYFENTPSASTLNGLDTTYSQLNKGDWSEDMGGAGFQNQIGLLPNWDALYITSDGDRRAFKSVVVNSLSIFSYPVLHPDSSDNAPIQLTDYENWNVSGIDGGGETSISAGDYVWDIAHHGSAGYLAYLLTGDYIHLEAMKYQSTLCYLFTNSTFGDSTERVLKPVQTRGMAWAHRTLGQTVGIAPSDDCTDELGEWLSYQADYWKTEVEQAGMNDIGYLWVYDIDLYASGTIAPWQTHFAIQTWGMVSDLEPLASMTNWNVSRDFYYKAIVGLLGPNGASYHCFTEAGDRYTLEISTGGDNDPTTWYDSWGTIWFEAEGDSNTSCANTLNGTSGGAPGNADEGYWGNLLGAIAYAVDDEATGASAAWARLIGATNWSTVTGSGFDDTPVWGIEPRNYSPTDDTAPTFTMSIDTNGYDSLDVAITSISSDLDSLIYAVNDTSTGIIDTVLTNSNINATVVNGGTGWNYLYVKAVDDSANYTYFASNVDSVNVPAEPSSATENLTGGGPGSITGDGIGSLE